MIDLRLFLLLFLAHFIGDYLFYNQAISEMKRSPMLWEQVLAMISHTAYHPFFAGIFIFPFYIGTGTKYFLIVGLVFLFHFTIDFSRCFLESRILKVKYHPAGPVVLLKALLTFDWKFMYEVRRNYIAGIADQLLHLASLYLIGAIV